MGTQLVRTNLGVLSNSTLTNRYVRNPELLELPQLVDGDEEVLMLVKVFEEGENWLTFRCRGAYEVDWGDGDVTTHNDNTQCYKSINWSGVSDTTLTSTGYRQAIVRVTPQAGQQLTSFDGLEAITEDPIFPNSSVVSVKMAGQNFTTLTNAFSSWYNLEDFEFVGTHNPTAMSSMFVGCVNLKKIYQLNTSSATNLSSFCSGCWNLLEVPPLNLDSCTSFNTAFFGCVNLTYLEPIDLSNSPLTSLNQSFRQCRMISRLPVKNTENITNFQYTFSEMENLTSIEGISFAAATTLNLTFSGCFNIERITPLAWPSNYTGTLNGTFQNCYRLKDITPFQTSGVTNMAITFNGCRKLQDLSWADMSSVTVANGTLRNAYSIKKPPVNFNPNFTNSLNQANYLNTGARNFIDFPNTVKPNNLYYFARQAYNVEKLPEFDTSNVTDIRGFSYQAYSISEIPAYNFSAVTNTDSNTFAYGYNVRKSGVYGITRTHSYQRCQLSREEIVNIFNNLGTASGSQTITVSLNPGSSSVTPAEIAIATGKGWTVTI